MLVLGANVNSFSALFYVAFVKASGMMTWRPSLALLFESERLHNVCPVTRGMRRSLVIELWARPENSSNRFR